MIIDSFGVRSAYDLWDGFLDISGRCSDDLYRCYISVANLHKLQFSAARIWTSVAESVEEVNRKIVHRAQHIRSLCSCSEVSTHF